jgi:hypothetical protein
VRPLVLVRRQFYIYVGEGEKLGNKLKSAVCDIGFWKWMTEESKTSGERERP